MCGVSSKPRDPSRGHVDSFCGLMWSAWKGVPSEVIIRAYLRLGLGTVFRFCYSRRSSEGERPGGFVGGRSGDGSQQCPKDGVVALQGWEVQI